MDRELEADEIAEDFGARMEGLFRDRGVDEMVRNFAVQHLERFAQNSMGTGFKQSALDCRIFSLEL